MAVADVQFCHGSAHPLLHHFLASQNRGQFLSEGLRERKMRLSRLRRTRLIVAPRAYWKGYLKLSLVSCPVALFPASSEREKISFNSCA
jgi:hypothetical protein